MVKNTFKIDETDEKIIYTCWAEGHSITALTKKIGIAYPNMIKRLNKLEEYQLIERKPAFVEPRGRQIIIHVTGHPMADTIMEKYAEKQKKKSESK